MFKIGDTITTNLSFNEQRKYSSWWNCHKGEFMTIRWVDGIFNEWCLVNENGFYWKLEEMLLKEDFLKEEEFEI